jgi:conjugal transfer pilus assembly protein TraK
MMGPLPFSAPALFGVGVAAFVAGSARVADTGLKPTGALLLGLGLACTTPAFADEYRQAADNASIDCSVSKRELTRISLIGDQFASVSKISTGYPFNDFAVTNEPVRGDIYISVPETYAARTISFFATTKKGYVYKFACTAKAIDAQQVFITNPALAADTAATWENETPLSQSAVRLIQAMANQDVIDGYALRQSPSAPTRAGEIEVQLIAEYRGAALAGKTIKLTNRGARPVTLAERDIAPKDTLAVSLAQPILAPGASTTAYLVSPNGETDHD